MTDRDMTETEVWLALWLNENAFVVGNVNKLLTVPISISFMLPALAAAIDKRVDSARKAMKARGGKVNTDED